MPREESPLYRDLKRKLEEEKACSKYWSGYYARHREELEQAEERLQQKEIAESMRLQAANDAPPFEEQLAADLREDLSNAINIIDEAITFYLEDESPISLRQMINLRDLIVSALDLHEQLN